MVRKPHVPVSYTIRTEKGFYTIVRQSKTVPIVNNEVPETLSSLHFQKAVSLASQVVGWRPGKFSSKFWTSLDVPEFSWFVLEQ